MTPDFSPVNRSKIIGANRANLVMSQRKIENIRGLIFWLNATHPIELIYSTIMNAAFDIGKRYQLPRKDNLIIQNALESTFNFHYFEEMQNEQLIKGSMHIVNPFVS
ncbi:MAG: hypothetical protein Q8R93_13530 [Methylicorpusculum sp.]|nr:hypothetical protein [Methylicorpusculum sp.]